MRTALHGINLCRHGAVVAALVTLGGCAPSAGKGAATDPKAPPPALLVVAVDRSGSTDPVRGAQLDTLDLLVKIALSGDRNLSVWAFDNHPVCLWGPRVPYGPAALEQVKRQELGPNSKANRRITRPALLLRALAQEPDFQRATAADIVLLTDGDAEDASDHTTFIKTAQELGKNPHLRLCIIGIRPEARPEWKQAFAATWGSRFVVAGPSEAKEAVHQFLP